MKLFHSLLETKVDAATISRVGGGFYAPVYGGVHRAYEDEKAFINGYERSLWVFKAVDAIASQQARLPMLLREGDRDDSKEVEDEHLMGLLNQRPNPYERARQFKYRCSIHLLLARVGLPIEAVRVGNQVQELHILPVGTKPLPWSEDDPWVHTAEGGRGRAVEPCLVKEFEVRGLNGRTYWLPPFDPNGNEESSVIWIRQRNHPSDPYSQMTPLVAAQLSVDTDYYARLFNRQFMMNDGRPGMLIGLRGRMNPSDAEEIKAYFASGMGIAGATRIIEIDDIQVADLSANPRDAQYQESIAGSKQEILQAFGVSDTFLGNASGRTFDNADAENEITWQTTMVEHCDAFAEGLDPLSGSDTDNRFIAHDYDKVEVLQRQKRLRHEKKAGEFAAGLCTIDNYFEYTGQDIWDVPGTRVLYLPTGQVIAQNDEDAKALAPEPPPGMEPGTEEPPGIEAGQEEPLAITQNGEGPDWARGLRARALRLAGKRAEIIAYEAKARRHAHQVVEGQAVRVTDLAPGNMEAKARPHPYVGLRVKAEAEFAATLSAWSRRQNRAVDAKITGKAIKFTRHWRGNETGTKAIDPSDVIDIGRWADDIRSDLEPMLNDLAVDWARQVASDLRAKGLHRAMGLDERADPLDSLTGGGVSTEMLLQTPTEGVLDMVSKAASNQSQKVADMIHQMDSEGASLDEIKAAVKRQVSTRGSWYNNLAVHATTALMEGITAELATEGGHHVTRTWNSLEDERVRKSHFLADGDQATNGHPFHVGEAFLMYPGDPTGPPGETINCRCWQTLDVG